MEEKYPSDFAASPADIVAAIADDGDPVETGISWLDERLRRGGLTPGRLLGIAGPPFAGKTNIVADAALTLAKHIPVFALFRDEGATQAAVRIGILLGLTVEEIEANPKTAAGRIRELAAERSLYLLKPDSDFANVSDIYDYVRSRVPKGETAGVILDSIQTIPARRDMEGYSDKRAFDEFMTIARGRTESDRRITVVTSWANRAFYRSKRDEDNAVAMSAFSGSAGIEYLCDVGLVLALPEEESEIVRAKFVKNRLGHFRRAARKSSILFLRYDDESGRMLEVDDATREEAAGAAARARLEPLIVKITELLKKNRAGLSAGKIIELSHIRRGDAYAALAAACSKDKPKIYAETVGRGVTYRYDSTRDP